MLGIIGGTGLYQVDGLTVIKQHRIDTPFGAPSAPIIEGAFEGGRRLCFLPRHGEGHGFIPSEINYRANIWALKSIGVRRVVSVSATGSLRQEIEPGDMVLVSQYFDHTRGKREYSFFGRGVVAHVSTARPSCPALSQDITKAAEKSGLSLHTDKTYACVEGPRLGTAAESHFLRSANCDVVGMTNVPEAFLAREAQMAYATLAIATDYDCWQDDPDQHVNASDIIKLYMENIDKVKTLIRTLSALEPSKTPSWISDALAHSIITPHDKIPSEHLDWLNVLLK